MRKKYSRYHFSKRSNSQKSKKDLWDKLSSISTFLSTVILTIVGLFISESYKERQNIRANEIKKVEVLEKFIPHLSSNDNLRIKTAILAIKSLGFDSLAIEIATYQSNDSIYAGTAALVEMYKNKPKNSEYAAIKNILLERGETGTSKEKELAYKTFQGYHWIIDNGHGSNSPEHKRSPFFDNDKFVYEGDINRQIAKKLFALLKANDVSFTNLVPSNDDVPVAERIQNINSLATNKPKIVVSIHANNSAIGNPWSEVEGVEVFYSSNNESSKSLANIFLSNITSATRAKSRTIKTHRFGIFRTADLTIPAILIESGFLDNKKELDSLRSATYQKRIAKGIYDAINFVELNGL